MADVSVVRLSGFEMITVEARKDVALETVVRAMGVHLPPGPHCVESDELCVVAVGRRTWLCMSRSEQRLEQLRDSVTSFASIFEHSAAFILFRVSGPGARGLLQSGCPIDLDPTAFGSGDAAATAIGHVPAQIWLTSPGQGFTLAVARSYALSLARWFKYKGTLL